MNPDFIPLTLGPLEQQIMDVLWNKAPQEVSGVLASLGQESTYSTVKTLLERLTTKGLLHREKVGKAYQYSPAVSRQGYERYQARNLSQHLLTGVGSASLSHFVDTVREDPAQLEELRRLLNELDEQ